MRTRRTRRLGRRGVEDDSLEDGRIVTGKEPVILHIFSREIGTYRRNIQLLSDSCRPYSFSLQ